METTVISWWGVIGQTLLVIAGSFVVLCIVTSLVRFQLMAEAADEARELGLDEERGFRLKIMNQIARARKEREPVTVMLARIPDGTLPLDEAARHLKSALRSTDDVMACGDGLVGLLLLCGSDRAEAIVQRIMAPEACGALDGADRWHFGVAGYPEHGHKTSALYDRALTNLDEAASHGHRIAGMAAPEEVAEEKTAPAHLADPLTGLIREDKMINVMRRYIAQARRADQPAAIAYLEVDQFARLAEQTGPDQADQIIKELAGELDRRLREQDLLCRFGAAGFVIGLQATPAATVKLVQRITAAVRKHTFGAGGGVKITLGAGVAGHPDVQGTAIQYFVAAETALHQAQTRGKHQVARYDASAPEIVPPLAADSQADRL